MHWALEGARSGQPRAPCRSACSPPSALGLTFLTIQINEYVHLGFALHDNAQGSVFYGLTGLHGAHVFVGLTLLAMATVRAFRGHFTAEGAPRRGGAGDLLALRRRDVDLRVTARCTCSDGGPWTQVLNPLRSEQEAFRFLIYVAVAVAVVVGPRAAAAGGLLNADLGAGRAGRAAGRRGAARLLRPPAGGARHEVQPHRPGVGRRPRGRAGDRGAAGGRAPRRRPAGRGGLAAARARTAAAGSWTRSTAP